MAKPEKAENVTAQTGRPLGPRALKTRERLMDATAELLAERSVLDISVVDIARKITPNNIPYIIFGLTCLIGFVLFGYIAISG